MTTARQNKSCFQDHSTERMLVHPTWTEVGIHSVCVGNIQSAEGSANAQCSEWRGFKESGLNNLNNSLIDGSAVFFNGLINWSI